MGSRVPPDSPEPNDVNPADTEAGTDETSCLSATICKRFPAPCHQERTTLGLVSKLGSLVRRTRHRADRLIGGANIQEEFFTGLISHTGNFRKTTWLGQ